MFNEKYLLKLLKSPGNIDEPDMTIIDPKQ